MSRSIHVTIKNFRGLNRKQFDEQLNDSDSELHQWATKKGIKEDVRELRNDKSEKHPDLTNQFTASLKAENLIVWKQIDEILWNGWDPIGVNAEASARDEYQSYIDDVLEFKINVADKEDVANYLFDIETRRMGLVGNKSHCVAVAEKIKNL